MAKILIAEDERDIRELISFTLTFAGHEIIQASNGAEAVDLAPKIMPDLIMMDVRMPRMTGYEACRAIKQMDSVKHIPVVFLSAKGQDDEVTDAMDAGAMDYITKPFSPTELTEKVASLLKKIGV
ncbi:MAG: two-component system response regulator [Phototrophicales bacterium]|jgi:DNA-binding response OmpR family regulator|nr:MAG: two-component system response regulator [Phototrophicales bacterium]